MQERQIALFMTEGKTDKVYQLQLQQQGDGWVVNFQNGRRGGALRNGVKTKAPVSYEAATKVFEKIVREKLSGGYTESDTGIAFRGTEDAERVTGYQPQLLNPVKEEELLALADTGDWLFQIKYDGERRGLCRADGKIVGSNRRGLEVPVAETIAAAFERLGDLGLATFEFDCEDMGSHLVVFDVINMGSEDLKALPFEMRASQLAIVADMVKKIGASDLIHVATPWSMSSAELRQKLIEMRESGEEGIVAKHRKGAYSAGRPNSGGNNLKLKFYETATFRVIGQTGHKRSIGLELFDGQNWVNMQNCTIPANQDVPAPGHLVEVKYLYAFAGGGLHQPSLIGRRTDLDDTAAVVSQLKYKS